MTQVWATIKKVTEIFKLSRPILEVIGSYVSET